MLGHRPYSDLVNDLTGTTVVLTGASAGIGAAAAVELAGRGARVALVGRTPDKLAAVAARVRAQTGSAPGTHRCDFASFTDVRALAEQLLATYDRIDVLANNAGALVRGQKTTPDGHELTIQANHLSPFLLTGLLLPRLLAAPDGARIITTASAAESRGHLDPARLDGRGGWRSYCASKQANILFTVELARRLHGTGVVPTCLHPGLVRSDFGTATPAFRLGRIFAPFAFVSPAQGASTLVHLATTADGTAAPGAYFANNSLANASKHSTDPALALRLWTVSEDLVGITFPLEPSTGDSRYR